MGSDDRRHICADRSYSGKRVVDVFVLALVSVPAVLLGLVCAVAIKVTSKGPVFFRQARVGLGERSFDVVKFRTMIDAPEGNPLFPDDDRITAAGHWLRRYSLDELPQLINVARGEMSVVGPRPTLAYQVERYDERQRGRHDVRPGLTGLAQIRGRNAITWDERIVHDLEYIDEQSPLLDLTILARTAGAILGGGGVEGHPTDDPLARPDGADPSNTGDPATP